MLPSARFLVDGDLLGLAALAVAGVGILAGGTLRRLRPARLWGPPAACLLGSAGFLAAASRLPAGLVVAGLILLAVSGAALVPGPGPHEDATRPARRGSLLALLASLLAAAGFLFYALDKPSQLLQTWECSVLLDFENEMIKGPSPAAAAASRLLWQEGLLSSGGDSLLYGLPTLLLLSKHAASLFSLRIAAALLALASLGLCWAVTRHLLGGTAAACGAVLWLLAPPFLCYGHYATSLSAMWTALWLALWAVSALVSRPSPARAALAAAALYVATLQYAPGRIVVVALLGLVAVALPAATATWRTKGVAALLLVAFVSAVLAIHARKHRIVEFYATRGEQVFGIRQYPHEAAKYLGHSVAAEPLSWIETAHLALRLAETNLSTFRAHVVPVIPLPRNGEAFFVDPPPIPLLPRAAVPLALWGLALSFRSAKSSRLFLTGLFVVFVLASLSLLQTNRVDAARAAGLLPFLVIWCGLGAADLLARVDRAAGRPVAAAAALLFVLGGAISVTSAILPAEMPRNVVGESLLAEIEAIDGPVRLGVQAPYQAVGSAWLAALDRLHRRGELLPALLDPDLVARLASEPESHPEAVNELVGIARLTPLLLGPATDFSRLHPLLEAGGLSVEPCGTREFPRLRVWEKTLGSGDQRVK